MCKDTTVPTCHIGSFNPYRDYPISLLLIDLPFSPMMLTILRSESIIDTYWVNPNLVERCCICATELRFSCSSFKNSIARYRCWIKGQIALLRKPGEGSLMFQRANSSLPRFAWRLYREKEKGLTYWGYMPPVFRDNRLHNSVSSSCHVSLVVQTLYES